MNFDRLLFYGGLILMVIFTTPMLFEYTSSLDTSTWNFVGAVQIAKFLKVVAILYLMVGVGAGTYLLWEDH